MTPNFPSKPLPCEIDNLLEQLYQAKRELQGEIPCGPGTDHSHPHFVLIARSEKAKTEFEERIMYYLGKKYGLELGALRAADVHPLTHASTFCFPEGVTISVILLPGYTHE